MFKINHQPRFTRTIEVRVPNGENFITETLVATFNVLPVDETTPEKVGSDEGQLAFLRKAIVSLDDIEGEDGKPIPYSPELRDQVLNRFDCRSALFNGYFAAIRGLAEGN
jgi:hypothetical protein